MLQMSDIYTRNAEKLPALRMAGLGFDKCSRNSRSCRKAVVLAEGPSSNAAEPWSICRGMGFRKYLKFQRLMLRDKLHILGEINGEKHNGGLK